MNIFPNHIPFDQLADYIEGKMPLDKRVELEAHLATCARCSEEIAQLGRLLEHLIGLMSTDSFEDAPPLVINRAVDQFRSRTVSTSTSSDLRRRILAALKFDSVGSAPAFGVRSGKPSTRQLLFSAEEYNINLRIELIGQVWFVSGQVLGGSTATGVAVLQGPAHISQAAFNELSEFMLQPVQAGSYNLTLNLENLDVEIDEIRIGLYDGSDEAGRVARSRE